MRNLKRALSLALASVMLLGMMVVGAGAASYPDVDDADNVEAIEVLNAVKVMIGDHGSFNPDKAVNRHEMAAIMARLVLGPEGAENYVGTHPFTDVYPWADKYVAACYENGLVNGTSATTFGGSAPLTAVQAAAMMLRALGYKDLSKGATDWRAPVTAAANRIRLFADVASNPSEQLTRNQVAQLALNTLKSPMVDTKEGLNITGNNGDYTFTISGDREYVVRSSTNHPVSGAIMRTEIQGGGADGLNGYALELGEHLYNGKLRLTDDIDDFGRPSRHWEYDGQEIGTYAKEELLRASYTVAVKGGTVYTDVGAEACDYDLDYYVNGNLLGTADTTAEANKLVRRNDDDLRTTDRGVLTEVYVNTQEQELTIVEIHTWLAQALIDYDSKNERISLEIYTGRDSVDPTKVISITKWLELEDFPTITGLKEDDFVMVTMAGPNVSLNTKDIMSLGEPAVVSDAYVSAYSSKPSNGDNHKLDDGRLKKVTADGKEYNISAEAYWDPEYLYDYSNDSQQLDGHRYDLLLDEYGYLLGIKNVTAAENVFFIVGYDDNTPVWGSGVDKARVIFPDGTMSEVNVKPKNASANLPGRDDPKLNTWYSYTVDADGVYVVSGMTDRQFAEVRNTVLDSGKINSTYTTMASSTVTSLSYNVRNDATAPTYVFGNDASVYIAVELDSSNRIDEINGVTTGIKSVNISPKAGTLRDTVGRPLDTTNYNVFGLYDKNGYVTYAVVVGEDGSTADNLVYLTSGITGSYYDTDIKEYVYQYDAITADSSEIVTINSLVRKSGANEVGGWLAEDSLYKAYYDSKGFVTRMDVRGDRNIDTNDDTYVDTAVYNTQAYKDAGYGLYTLTNDTQALKLSGNTLYLNATQNNDQYVLITGDTKFFVENTDDPDNGYELYPNASSALAALGTGNLISKNGVPANKALIAMICDTATGYAKTIIIRDHKYEGGNTTPSGSFSWSTADIYKRGANDFCLRIRGLTNTTGTNQNLELDFKLYRVVDNGTGYYLGGATENWIVPSPCKDTLYATYSWDLVPGMYYFTLNGQTSNYFTVNP